MSFDPPEVFYSLEHVFGYRCADTRQNVFANSEGKTVYITAALGVILNSDCDVPQQTFFGGGMVPSGDKKVASDMEHHTNDIMCLDVSRDGNVAVSGQVGSAPVMFTWNACTGEKMQRFKLPKGSRAINACAISSCKNFVACADMHNDHNVYVFDANSGDLLFKDKGGPDRILEMKFDGAEGSTRFCTVGRKHVAFWNHADHSKEKGIFGSFKRTSFSCVAWDDQGATFCGGANGMLYKF